MMIAIFAGNQQIHTVYPHAHTMESEEAHTTSHDRSGVGPSPNDADAAARTTTMATSSSSSRPSSPPPVRTPARASSLVARRVDASSR